jgi:hypothetical protein
VPGAGSVGPAGDSGPGQPSAEDPAQSPPEQPPLGESPATTPTTSPAGPEALPLRPAAPPAATVSSTTTVATSLDRPGSSTPGRSDGLTQATSPAVHRTTAPRDAGAMAAAPQAPAGQPAPGFPIAPNGDAPAATAPGSGSTATSGSGGLQVAAVIAGSTPPDHRLFAVPARADAAALPQHIADPGFSPD